MLIAHDLGRRRGAGRGEWGGERPPKSAVSGGGVGVGHEVGHLATWFLPGEVRILKFRTAHVSSQDGEKHRNEGFVHVF